VTSSAGGDHPAAAKQQAGTEGREENRLAMLRRLRRGMVQRVVQCRAAHGRAQIASRRANRRKMLRGHSQLLCKELYEARIRLVCGESSNAVARNAAAMFDLVDYFLHAVYGSTGERIAIKLDVETASAGVADGDGIRILRGAPEEKFTQPVREFLRVSQLRGHKKSAGTVSEQPAKFTGSPSRAKRAAVHVGRGHQNFLGTAGNEQGLSDGKRLQKREAAAAYIQGVTVFTQVKPSMENG